MGKFKTEIKIGARERFVTAFAEYQKQTGKSTKTISEELGIDLSTIKNSIHPEMKNLNSDFVIAFCMKYRTVNIDYIYSGDIKAPEKEVSSNSTVFTHSKDCHELCDESFFGDFYGYCRNTIDNNIIDNFTLSIKRNFYGSVQATMTLYSTNHKKEQNIKVLYGKPMHLEPYIIYIVLQSETGDDMFILSYDWFKINFGKKLHLRKGALITVSRTSTRFPNGESFILLDKPIPESNYNLLDGALVLCQDKIIIKSEKFDDEQKGLRQNDETIKEFFNKCKELNYIKEEYYCFSEKVLLAIAQANEIDEELAAKTILKLKANSINPRSIEFETNINTTKMLSTLIK